jgi:hypothetical protein
MSPTSSHINVGVESIIGTNDPWALRKLFSHGVIELPTRARVALRAVDGWLSRFDSRFPCAFR